MALGLALWIGRRVLMLSVACTAIQPAAARIASFVCATRLRRCTPLPVARARIEQATRACYGDNTEPEVQSSSPTTFAQLGPQLADCSTQKLDAGLHIVPTPIGNLEDITLRAIRVLQQASTVLAEDTRHTRKLLVHYGIRTQLLSLHEHNEHSRIGQVLEQLEMGASLALVSDAGTPAISDPGSRIISAAIAAGHRVIPLPGASAALAALVASGLPADDFRFLGFLPPKSGARRKRLQQLAEEAATLIFYVPPHSLAAVLADAAEVLGSDRSCVVARELTKVNEEVIRTSLADAAEHYSSTPTKGEITLLIEGRRPVSRSKPPDQEQLQAKLEGLLRAGASASSAAKLAAAECGVPKRAVYDLAVQLAAEQGPQSD